MKRIVLTGPSGCGKSSTLELLKEQGYNVMPEVARPLLEMGLNNTALVQNMMIYAQMYSESIQPKDEIIFFDRGIWDYVGFSKQLDVHIPWNLYENVESIRYDKVFSLDALPAFENDGLRIEESAEESQVFSKRVNNEYTKAGYEIDHVPVMSVEDRVNYILSKI